MLGWIIYTLDWVIALALLPLIMRKPRHAVKLAWIAVIFALPFVGAGFYLLFGENRFGHSRVRRRGEVKKLINLVERSARVAPHIVAPRIRAEHADLARLTERLGDLPALGGNTVSMLGGGDEMIDALIADIDRAKDHAHLMYYIFAGDRTGLRVAEALNRAVGRGVTCRVLVDDAGSRSTFSKVERFLIGGKVLVRRMLPASILRVPLRRMDVRNHRKLAVIDGTVAYVGSQNIVDASAASRPRDVYHDLTVCVKGPAVMALQMTFLDDWLAETGESIEDDRLFPRSVSETGIAVQIVRSGPPYPPESFSHVIVAAIHEAGERVTITTPYFVPDESTYSALRIAALRGVRVEVVLPRKSDSSLVDAAARAHFNLLLDVGVHIYRHAPGVLHSKTLAVDDSFALIGSGNMDQRSFGLNYELNVLLFGAKVTEQLRVHQDRYIAASTTINGEKWQRRPKVQRAVDSVASLFSPLL
jgi:cardiolipin synthase